MEKVKLELVGLDGNAFSLMGAFKRAARQQKFDSAWIANVLEECMAGDYNHLLATLLSYTESPDDEAAKEDEARFLEELNRSYAKDRA